MYRSFFEKRAPFAAVVVAADRQTLEGIIPLVLKRGAPAGTQHARWSGPKGTDRHKAKLRPEDHGPRLGVEI